MLSVWVVVSFWLRASLTWGDQGPGADGVNVTAHVNRPHFCQCCVVSLFPSVRWIVSGSGLCSCGGSLGRVFHRWGRLNGHRGLFQTESLQRLSLRGGRGRHLLATDGKILDLILAEAKNIYIYWFTYQPDASYKCLETKISFKCTYQGGRLRGVLWLDSRHGGCGSENELWGERNSLTQPSGHLNQVVLLRLESITSVSTTCLYSSAPHQKLHFGDGLVHLWCLRGWVILSFTPR